MNKKSSELNVDNLPQSLGLYIHFPFCVRKCNYCDFLSFPADGAAREDYVGQLIREIRYRAEALKGRNVRSIFIGGGTPSLMSAGQLDRIMNAVFQNYRVESGAEISMECNPGTVSAVCGSPCQKPRIRFSDIKSCGINRLSLGLQSMNKDELKILGRIHDSRQFLESYEAARGAGFDNINVDLMSGLPGQTLSSWMQTLKAVISLTPEHISAYSLIIEEGTPFYEIYSEDGLARTYPPLPDEDSEREMYHQTAAFLAESGYTHYEISNYAKPGYECRHNLSYWYGTDYQGFGLGASSLIDGRRFSNTRDMNIYMKLSGSQFDLPPAIIDEQILSDADRMSETMFLGLRCITGVGIRDFERKFSRSIFDVYGDVVEKYISYGMLENKGGRIVLTERGIDVSNWILADFV